MSKARSELKLYKQLKADIVNIDIDIEEIKNDSGIIAVSYSERVQISATNDSMDKLLEVRNKRIEELNHKKKKLDLRVKRVDNALTILEDREKTVITLAYIENKNWENVCYTVDRSYSQVRRIADEALDKLKRYYK